MGQTYQTTKYRLPDSIYSKEPDMEKLYGIDEIRLYGYEEGDESFHIVGEIFAKKAPAKSFCIMCTVYDRDGDIIETKESRSYGSGLVTSMIEPISFFNGFPFIFDLWGVPKKKIKEIRIAPAGSY
jgi:hypothetical protein